MLAWKLQKESKFRETGAEQEKPVQQLQTTKAKQPHAALCCWDGALAGSF